MLKFLIGGAAAAAVLAIAPAMAQTAPPAPVIAHPPHMMKAETRADVQARVGKMFARLDTNHDGFITKAEVDAMQAERTQKIEQRAQRFDPTKIFARLDLNHDGQITQAEAEAARNARVQAKTGQPAQAHAAAFGGLFKRADANKDGVITRAEFDTVANQMHARMEQAGLHGGFAGRMFDLADANKDGRLSLAEVQQMALQHFDRADLNHDGTVTPQERKQSRAQMHAQHPRA
jgi:Ca2+-binding EF-hand superfamily protein